MIRMAKGILKVDKTGGEGRIAPKTEYNSTNPQQRWLSIVHKDYSRKVEEIYKEQCKRGTGSL